MGEKYFVAFVGLYDDDNLGDYIIQRCTEHLFCGKESEFGIKRISLYSPVVKRLPNLLERILYGWRRKLFRGRKEYFNATMLLYLKDVEHYYYECLKGTDLIVIVGGGLIKYRYQFCCWELFHVY